MKEKKKERKEERKRSQVRKKEFRKERNKEFFGYRFSRHPLRARSIIQPFTAEHLHRILPNPGHRYQPMTTAAYIPPALASTPCHCRQLFYYHFFYLQKENFTIVTPSRNTFCVCKFLSCKDHNRYNRQLFFITAAILPTERKLYRCTTLKINVLCMHFFFYIRT